MGVINRKASTMSRRQLPPQIKKVPVLDRKTDKPVVRYQLTVDAGSDPITDRRRQVRRRFKTEREAREELGKITEQAATDTFVPRKAVMLEELCKDWLASLHNARPTTVNAYRYSLAPLRERHGGIVAQKLTRPDLDRLLTDLRDGRHHDSQGSPTPAVVTAVVE
jgi:hypothetical protein